MRKPVLAVWMSLGVLLLLGFYALSMPDLDLVRRYVATPTSAEIRLISVEEAPRGARADLGFWNGPLGPMEAFTLYQHGFPSTGFHAYMEVGGQEVETQAGEPIVIESENPDTGKKEKKVLVAEEETTVDGEEAVVVREYDSEPKITQMEEKTGKVKSKPVDLPKNKGEQIEVEDMEEGHVRRTRVEYSGGDQGYDYVTVHTQTGKKVTLAVKRGRKTSVRHPTNDHPEMEVYDPADKLHPVKVRVVANRGDGGKGPAGSLVDAIRDTMRGLGLIKGDDEK